MSRVLGFVAVAAGSTYLAIGWLGVRLTGVPPGPLTRASASILVGVLLWTLLMWWKADDLGRTEEVDSDDGSPV